MPEAAVRTGDAGRQPVAEDVRDGTRGEVKHGDVGGRQVAGLPYLDSGLDRAAALGERRGQRRSDRPRATGGDGPAVPVSGGDDAQRDGGGERVVQRPECMRRHAAEQCPTALGAEQPGEHGTRQECWKSEPSQSEWMLRYPQQRSHDVLAQHIEAGSRPGERQPPASTVRPRPAAVSSTERCSTPASPPSSGCTQSISGRRQIRPCRSRLRLCRNADPTAMGWIAEQ